MKDQPNNLVLGLDAWGFENPGKTTDLNMLSSTLTIQHMKMLTTPGEKERGLEGDFLRWEKSVEEKKWTLHSKARWVELDCELQGPCRAKAKMNAFKMDQNYWHSECMDLCEKPGGRSPSVKTRPSVMEVSL